MLAKFRKLEGPNLEKMKETKMQIAMLTFACTLTKTLPCNECVPSSEEPTKMKVS
jgi:hypothetical protein